MADGVWKKQNLLVRNRQVGERIQIEEQLIRQHFLLEPRIDDGRREEPEHQDVCEDIADIAEVHCQRRQREADARREDQLHKDRHRKPCQVPHIRRMPIQDQEEDRNRQREKEVHHVRQHADDGQDFGRKEHLLDQIAPAISDPVASVSEAANQVHGRMPHNMNSA